MLLAIPENTAEKLLVGEQSASDGNCLVKVFRWAISRAGEGTPPCL
jgi:hypothetical protein